MVFKFLCMYYKEENEEEEEDGYDASGCSSVVFCGLLFSYYCVLK